MRGAEAGRQALPRYVLEIQSRMNILLLPFLALCAGANLFHNVKSRSERSPSQDIFEEKLEQGYELLKGEPNADDTRNLLHQLHQMEPEIKQELNLSPEREAELRDEMKNYVGVERDHLRSSSETIEEINANTNVDGALFQGDILLTRGPGCFSYIGRIGGEQGLSLGDRCDMVGIATHEAGHALGFFHTQSRHDRDDFITLYTQNFRTNALVALQQIARMVVSLIRGIALNVSAQADMEEISAVKELEG
ncbi:Astacin (Peptidase M12A) [Parelaphostrongylus tenuis]|uniref:Metalloendopeptidase n=1 Tax=Parelaphostrongylus tenuis TaxID=148309 RepID=A0AAD5LWQ9_PARTN|nr:Astacin (Peptidase M12A) [Parelaphostrongylus tenuis]